MINNKNKIPNKIIFLTNKPIDSSKIAFLDERGKLQLDQLPYTAGNNIEISPDGVISAILKREVHEVSKDTKTNIVDGESGALILLPGGETLIKALDNIVQDIKVYIYAKTDDNLNIEKYKVSFLLTKNNGILHASDPVCESVYKIGDQIVRIADVIANESDPNLGVNIKVLTLINNVNVYSSIEFTQLKIDSQF